MLLREGLHGVIVHFARFGIHPVLHRAIELAGKVHRGPVRQVPAVGKAHAEDAVAGFEQCEVHCRVRLGTGVGLHVCKVRSKKRFDAVDGELLDDVDVLAAAVVAPRRVPFRVLVGEHAALRRQHARTGVVLRRDQFDMLFLPPIFLFDRKPHLVVETTNRQTFREHPLSLFLVRRFPVHIVTLGVPQGLNTPHQMDASCSPEKAGSGSLIDCGLQCLDSLQQRIKSRRLGADDAGSAHRVVVGSQADKLVFIGNEP